MVIVNRRGRLGNVLFQYVFGRLLAAPRGLAVKPSFTYPGLPELRPVAGISIDRVMLLTDCDDNEGIVFDMEKMSKLDCGFVVDGFFQHKSYYEQHRQLIKQWIFDVPQKEDAMGIHMRFDDYLQLGWDLPWEYYEKCIKNSSVNKLLIFTDDIHHPYVKRLRSIGAEVSNLPEMDDFKRLASCREIVMSRSSFSWWAAFLSNANKIYFPRPETGWWSLKETPHKDLLLSYPEYEIIHI